MDINQNYIEGFFNTLTDEGMTEEQVMEAFIINAGNEMLKDASFNSGFSEVIEQFKADVPSDPLYLRKMIGTYILSSMIEADE
jgi:hypothetical protein